MDAQVVLSLALAAAWVFLVIQAIVLVGLIRLLAQVQAEMRAQVMHNEDRLAGQPAPAFTARDYSGREISLDGMLGRLSALLFVSPHCQACEASLEEVAALGGKVNGNLAVVCRSSQTECEGLAARYGKSVRLIVDEDDAIAQSYLVDRVPTAVLIEPDGRIRSYGQPQRRDFEELGASGEIRAAAVST